MVALMIAVAALQREETRGSHYRSECPGAPKRRALRNLILGKSLERAVASGHVFAAKKLLL
ncbi:hypothetical protein [Mesorhizobium sp. M1005]|uniref:hypothetical protein n=2 Tax=unclassified Mesorhizobium TaxID=325217 RepID=UPI00333B17BA